MGCSVCGELPLRCRGYCNRHYIAWRRHGDPLGAKFSHSKNQPGTVEYIKENIVRMPGKLSTDCWIWQKAKSENGYGVFGYQDRSTEYAHRRIYELDVDSNIDGFFICHYCDTPACCNPEHLFKATCADNNMDMINKGRDRKDRHLSIEEVKIIKWRLSNGETALDISKDFHVHPRHIRDIKEGRTYNEVQYFKSN